MDKGLEAIRDAWRDRPAAGDRSSDPDGRELAQEDKSVYQLADDYVASNTDAYAGYDNLSMDLLVKQLEEYRGKGDEDGEWKIQAYLFHRFEPQNIGGPVEATVRIPNG